MFDCCSLLLVALYSAILFFLICDSDGVISRSQVTFATTPKSDELVVQLGGKQELMIQVTNGHSVQCLLSDH